MAGIGRLPFFVALVLVQFVLIVGGVWYLSAQFNRTVDDRAHFTQIQALLLAEHASAALRQTEFALRNVAVSAGVAAAGEIEPNACAALRRAAVTVPAIATAVVVGPDGDIACSLPGRPTPTLDLDRITRLHGVGLTDFSAELHGAVSDGVAYGLSMSVRLDDRDHRYAGSVAAVVSHDYFTTRYEEFGSIDVDLVVLYDQDGTVLARWPEDRSEHGTGGNVTGIGLLSTVPDGDLVASGLRTYVNRALVGSLYKLSDYPYRIMVAYARETLRSRWFEDARALIAALATLAATIAVAAVWIRRSIVSVFVAQRDRDAARRDEQEERIRRLQGLSSLSGGLAHEINNQMMVVLGNANLAGDAQGTGSVHDATAKIREAATRAARLSERMLTASGDTMVERVRLDVHHLVRQFAAHRATDAPPCVTIAAPAYADPVWLDGDPALIEAALTNLVDNAIESFGGERDGTVRITLARARAEDLAANEVVSDRIEPGEYVRISVADDGPGMDADTLGRMLDPFFSTRFLGRGLGLAVVLGIARQHGGAVIARSSPGVGTEVGIVLPVAAD